MESYYSKHERGVSAVSIKRALDLLERSAKSEQRRGADKLNALGITVTDKTIEGVIDKIPANQSSGVFASNISYASLRPLDETLTTEDIYAHN